jgi:hypothetical protein
MKTVIADRSEAVLLRDVTRNTTITTTSLPQGAESADQMAMQDAASTAAPTRDDADTDTEKAKAKTKKIAMLRARDIAGEMTTGIENVAATNRAAGGMVAGKDRSPATAKTVPTKAVRQIAWCLPSEPRWRSFLRCQAPSLPCALFWLL